MAKTLASSFQVADFETLDDWTEEQQRYAAETTATAKYGALSEALRRSMTEARLCSMFCGGKNCKYEGANSWSDSHRVIPGLYSHWYRKYCCLLVDLYDRVTNNILAMARPNSPVIEKYDIIGSFKESGIKSIFNLQIPGEHATCGPGLDPSGFTYNPQQFMDSGIFFYNYGWRDYSVGTMGGIADVVRVMQFELSQGKVAIHCHAGLGRTGVLIACYLVFTNRCDPDIAIHYIRRKRPGAIQTRSQIKCIREFAQFLWPSRIIFSSVKPKSSEFTLGQFLSRQKYAVHGIEARRLKYLPKILHVCCDRLLDIALRACHLDEHKVCLFHAPTRLLRLARTADNSVPDGGGRSAAAAAVQYFAADGSTQPPMPVNVCVTSESRLLTVVPVRPSVSCESFLPVPIHGRLSPLPQSSARPSSPSERLPPIALQKSWAAPGSRSDDLLSLPGTFTSLDHGRVSPSERVALAMACTDYPPEVLTKAESYKQNLNTSGLEWNRLGVEDNPLVFSALMWDWIDELKEPVLSVQDLPMLLDHVDKPADAVALLHKSVRQTVSYIFHVVACLEPMSDSLRSNVVQRILSTLMQQKMVVELQTSENRLSASAESDDVSEASVDLSSSQSYDQLLRRTANDGVMRKGVADRVLAFFMAYLHQQTVCSCVNGHREHRQPLQSTTSDVRRLTVNGRRHRLALD